MKLSRREAELLELLRSGSAVHEAADKLDITVSSASTYLRRARYKLGAKTSFETVAIFAREKVKEEI